MKTSHSNIVYTTLQNHCLGCGLSAGASLANLIKIRTVDGKCRPTIDFSICSNSKGINLAQIGQEKRGNYPESKFHKLVVFYSLVYFDYAMDYEAHFHEASGDLLTAFVTFLVGKEFVSAAVVVNNEVSQLFLNKTVFMMDYPLFIKKGKVD